MEGTPSTTSIPTDLDFATADDIKGLQFVVASGDAAADIRWVSAYAVTNGVITPNSALSATPSAGDTLDLVRADVATVEEINELIDAAYGTLLEVRWLPLDDTTLRVDDLMFGDGQMERWTDGASSAPDGFALSGTGAAVARSTTRDSGLYSAQVTNGASNAAYLEWSRPDYLKWQGQTFTVKALCRASAASRARLYISDGVATDYSDYHTGGSNFEELSASLQLDDDATEFVVRLRTETGTATAVQWDDVRTYGPKLSQYAIPPDLVSISDIRIGLLRLAGVQWDVSPLVPVIATDGHTPAGTLFIYKTLTQDKWMLLKGSKRLSLPTADSSTIPDAFAEYIRYYVMASVRERAAATEVDAALAETTRRRANSLFADLYVSPRPGARRIAD